MNTTDLERAFDAANGVTGLISRAEGTYLHALATCAVAATGGDIVDLGSWRGKSASFLALAARAAGRRVICVDTWEHPGDLIQFIRGLSGIGLLGSVCPVQMDPAAAAERLGCHDLAMVVIDADHLSPEAAWGAWSHRVAPGGIIVLRDSPEPGRPKVGGLVESVVRPSTDWEYLGVIEHAIGFRRAGRPALPRLEVPPAPLRLPEAAPLPLPAPPPVPTAQARPVAVAFLTMATGEGKLFREFARSAGRFGIQPILMGWGQPFTGLGMRLRLLTERLRALAGRCELFVLTDAYDSLFVRGPAVMIEKYREMGHPLVFAAEKNCWPDGTKAGQYPPSDTPWRFLNAGGVIGRVDVMLDILERYKADEAPLGMDDQGFYTEVFLKEPGAIKLDTHCEIFQTLLGSVEDLECGELVRNRVTGTCPCVLHANGCEGLDWMGALALARFGPA